MTERRRRRAGCLSILLVLVLILGVVFSVVDRVAVGMADDQVATMVKKEAEQRGATPTTTTADIQGFPFLTQVARGRFDTVHIVFTDVRTKTIAVGKVDVVLEDLTVPRDVLTGGSAHDVVAGRVRGSATIALAEVQKGFGAQGLVLSGAGDVVRFTAPVPLPGLALVASGSARVRLQDGRVWLEIIEATANGVPIPKQALDVITRQLKSGAKIPPLPLGLHVSDISLAGSVVTIKADSTNVTLA